MAAFRCRIVVALGLLAALALSSLARGDHNYGDPGALAAFHDAAVNTDLREPGGQPFELLSDIKLDIRGQWLNGTYLLLWDSPDLWREEVILPGYQRVKVQDQSGLWLHRSLNYEVPSVKDLDDALDFSDSLLRDVQFKPGKLKVKNVSGALLDCSRVKLDDGIDDEDFCFDLQQSLLKIVLFPSGATAAPNITSIEYSDFEPFGTKLYPHTVRILSASETFLTFSVQRLALLVRPPASDFAVPAGAMFMAACASAEKVKLIKQALPQYPPDEKSNRRSAHLVLYVLIAPDGSVRNAKVIFPGAADFNSSALAAVRQWRYQPVSCGGTPASVEKYVPVYFSIQ